MYIPSISHTRKRVRLDNIAQRVIVFFGWTVLVMLSILIWHLASSALPLFKSPSIQYLESTMLPMQEKLLSVGDWRRGGVIISRAPGCELHFRKRSVTKQLQLIKTIRLPCESDVSVILYQGKTFLSELSAAGILRINEVRNTDDSIELGLMLSRSLPDDYQGERELQISITQRWVIVHSTGLAQQYLLWIDRQQIENAYLQSFDTQTSLSALPSADMTVSLSPTGLAVWPVDKNVKQEVFNSVDIKGFITTTAEPRTVYQSQTKGQFSKWSVFNNKGQFELNKLFTVVLAPDESPTHISVDPSVNLGLVVTDNRRILLFNRSTGEVLHHYRLVKMPADLSWFDDYLYLQQGNQVQVWQVNNRDSSTTLTALFEPQLYSGYQQPDYIWQTTSATDYQIAKYSIVPLIIGSLKASVIALIVAIPLALGAAIYTAFFATAAMRNKLKPTIEMLEAIPSVVIGFIAAVWLAPFAERFLIALAAFLVLMPSTLILTVILQSKVVERLPLKLRRLGELPIVSLIVACIASICLIFGLDIFLAVSQQLQLPLLGWFTDTPTSKTTLVVAIALGIAISPTIFSLAEDAIEAVPEGLKRASFALGATRLQTLKNVVLKTAFPGIVAALMLGLGRAFGETMIVLMVTGNTPVADWDLLASLRAMTANLAIELPESEVDSAHYRVLFLTAFLLFLFTFVVNTIAEILRVRSRKVGAI